VTRDGGFADYVVVPTANVYPVGCMPFEVAAFIEPISCVVCGLKRLRVSLGANALIYGAGPIGLLMLQLLARAGASTTVVVDLEQDRLTLARHLGATTRSPRVPAPTTPSERSRRSASTWLSTVPVCRVWSSTCSPACATRESSSSSA
jgi:threonine dehydrogenase-like Zn-dependent dehydrogenase